MNILKAIDLCRRLEPKFSRFGYHVGLTGGCLYKEGERKDVDIIVYPHQDKNVVPVPELLEKIKSTGLTYEREGTGLSMGYDAKEVHVFKLGNNRIDFFLLK